MKVTLIIAVLCFFSLQSCMQHETAEPLFCEAEKELLQWSDFDEDSIVELDFSLPIDSFFVNVAAQQNFDTCIGSRYYTARAIIFKDTISFLANIGKRFCSCCPSIPPCIILPRITILINEQKQLLCEDEYVDLNNLKYSVIANTIKHYEIYKQKNIKYDVYWKSGMDNKLKNEILEAITKGYLEFIKIQFQTDICVWKKDSEIEYPRFILQIQDLLPPPPPPPFPDSLNLGH